MYLNLLCSALIKVPVPILLTPSPPSEEQLTAHMFILKYTGTAVA